MFTSDLALRFDPAYEAIGRRFQKDPAAFADAFARAWFKLTHRDMGPKARYLGPLVPAEDLIWQDPVPASHHHHLRRRHRHTENKNPRLRPHHLAARLHSLGLSRHPSAVPTNAAEPTEPASASNRSATGKSTSRRSSTKVLTALEAIQKDFNVAQSTATEGGNPVSLADLIVLGGCAAVEEAAKKAGYNITVPFTPGRTDATEAQTDAASFAPLEQKADGFRNFLTPGHTLRPEDLLIDRAQLLTLTAPEMTVLLGGLRVLGANFRGSKNGVFTTNPGTLTNDFFVNLLSMSTEWKPAATGEGLFEGLDRTTGEVRWTATRVDLIFGSNSQLRALAEVYASTDYKETFVKDFVAAWNKVMNLDRFDLHK